MAGASFLMRTAYSVHGMIAPVLPFEISKTTKDRIRSTIDCVDQGCDIFASYLLFGARQAATDHKNRVEKKNV